MCQNCHSISTSTSLYHTYQHTLYLDSLQSHQLHNLGLLHRILPHHIPHSLTLLSLDFSVLKKVRLAKIDGEYLCTCKTDKIRCEFRMRLKWGLSKISGSLGFEWDLSRTQCSLLFNLKLPDCWKMLNNLTSLKRVLGVLFIFTW